LLSYPRNLMEGNWLVGNSGRNTPEKVWVRKVFFQIHLWVGGGVATYILLMSISGSLIVYRNELSRRFSIHDLFPHKFDTGICDDDIEMVEAPHRGGEQTIDVGHFGYVGLHCDRSAAQPLDRGHRILRPLFTPGIVDDKAGAQPAKSLGDGLANSACRARDVTMPARSVRCQCPLG